jgi:hypothetical protein
MEHNNNPIKAAIDFINSLIFSLKRSTPKLATTRFPNMSDETFELMQSIESHVLSCNQKFLIETAGYNSCRAIFIAESVDTAFLWRIDCNLIPRFYFLEKSKIKHCFHKKLYADTYADNHEGFPPPLPEMIIGQDWEFEPHAGGHWLTCLTPSFGGVIEYSDLLDKFQTLYSLRPQAKSKGKTGKSDDAGSFSSFDLKPSKPVGGNHDFNR